jgi:hypothetical protein
MKTTKYFATTTVLISLTCTLLGCSKNTSVAAEQIPAAAGQQLQIM